MNLNTLPPEILERIFEFTDKGIFKCALVCRRWADLANPIIWKGVTVKANNRISKNISFVFYRKITNPEHICRLYIRKLTLDSVTFWPVCIAKILRACPGIVELGILRYKPEELTYNGRRNPLDLNFIPIALPNLRKLDLSYSENHFGEDNIQRLIDSKKSYHIKATKICPLCQRKPIRHYIFYDSSKSKEWQLDEKACIQEIV